MMNMDSFSNYRFQPLQKDGKRQEFGSFHLCLGMVKGRNPVGQSRTYATPEMVPFY